MGFSEKLAALRRMEALSQEQLADRLGVTRQSVSKWEGGSAMPELSKLIALSEFFGVSIDYLVKDWLEEAENRTRSAEPHHTDIDRLEKQVTYISRYVRGYAYDSKTCIFGIPLVSVRLTNHTFLGPDNIAKGIIAIGNGAIGVVAGGAFSLGLISFGAVSLGILSVGALASGLVALGAVAIGGFAFGSAAVGIYAGGAAALGRQIAVGISAVAEQTAVGKDAEAIHTLLWDAGLTRAQVEAFLSEYHPNLWHPFLQFLGWLGANIK